MFRKIIYILVILLISSCNKSFKVETDGIKSTYKSGIIYRYEDKIPMLEVEGDYYEMGLQYGVLLKHEIMIAVNSFEKIFELNAKQFDINIHLFKFLLKRTTKKLSKKLPKGYLDEIKGVSKGSGVPVSKILMISLSYDALNSMACTSVLLKGKNGTIIHGRNNDTAGFGGDELGTLTTIVKHKRSGFNEVTHIDYPLFLGIQTAYNNKGLSVSEQTYEVKETKKNMFPYSYLIRMILETENTLEGVKTKAEKYSTTGGHGVIWSDKKTGEGILMEIIQDNMEVINIDKNIFWNLNNAINDRIKKYEYKTGYDYRQNVASTFSSKDFYDITECISFLRLNTINNSSTQQSIVFHPTMNGLYLAVGLSNAAKNDYNFYHDDFSIKPIKLIGLDN